MVLVKLFASARQNLSNKRLACSLRCISYRSNTNHYQQNQDVSKLMTGVNNADMESNPALVEFVKENFPSYGNNEERSSDFTASATDIEDDISIKQGETAVKNNIRSLWGYNRKWGKEQGTLRCDYLRGKDLIPGIIYGSDPTKNILSIDASSKILVKTPANQIQREMNRFTYHKFETRVYDLTVYRGPGDEEGILHRVMPRNVQHHPVMNSVVTCVNYLRYFPGRIINIPIVNINEEESPALKKDGFIAPISRYVPCIVEEGVAIPESLDLDCTGMRIKEVIRMDRIIIPDGVTVSTKLNKENFLVGTVFGRRSDDDDDDVVDGTSGDGGEGDK